MSTCRTDPHPFEVHKDRFLLRDWCRSLEQFFHPTSRNERKMKFTIQKYKSILYFGVNVFVSDTYDGTFVSFTLKKSPALILPILQTLPTTPITKTKTLDLLSLLLYVPVRHRDFYINEICAVLPKNYVQSYLEKFHIKCNNARDSF